MTILHKEKAGLHTALGWRVHMHHVHWGAWIWGLQWQTEGTKTRPQKETCPKGVATAASMLEITPWPTRQIKLLQILPICLTLHWGADNSTLSIALPSTHLSRPTHPTACHLQTVSLLFFQTKTAQKPHNLATSKATSSWGQIKFSQTASGVKFNLQLPKCLSYSHAWHNKDLVLAVLACLIHS